MKVVLITASTGIGAATAKLLGAQGWSIFVTSLSPEHVKAFVQELKKLGIEADGVACDISKPESPAYIINKCLGTFGRIDALYNVAGISGRKYGDGPLELCTDEGWQTVLDINLTSQFRMCREVVQHWLKDSEKYNERVRSILNMASILGIDPMPEYFDTLAYGVSKAAVIGMSKILASTYASNRISVNAIAPGLVETPMSARASQDPKIGSAVEKKQRLSKGMIPIDAVAKLSAFMLSDGCISMTGEVVHPDGGWRVS
ncbi:TPA: SDR family oxidoreductase [Aeromonas veronii]|nr:SDR family oxidoreductase [Aeromonas veronii]HDO1327351.1 SDR family oxidoreductase [Aeromonas veronii]HDO1377072.1 SDR family oxidoreductase [Aeromonas veronii]